MVTEVRLLKPTMERYESYIYIAVWKANADIKMSCMP